jgi:Na+-transporting NADH:ubiquinone oxidoreductase subunit C
MKKAILTVLFTILITVVFVAPIALAYLLTKPMVALNEEVFLKKSVLFAAGIALPPTNSEVVSLFSQRVQAETPSAGPAWYRVRAAEGDATAGYVFLRSGPGLWGEITATVGFDASFAALTGVDFLKQTETPGLGARISEDWFREQFRGKRGPLTSVPEGEPAGESQIDAITGATFTSNAVLVIVNSAFTEAPGLVQ